MKIQVHNKFYFYQQFPFLVLDALFGQEFSKFNLETEIINAKRRNQRSDIKVFHVLTQAHMSKIIAVTDLDLYQNYTYKDVEVEHIFFFFSMIHHVGVAVLDNNPSTKCYGWSEQEVWVNLIFNNYDSTALLLAQFLPPVLQQVGTIQEGTF